MMKLGRNDFPGMTAAVEELFSGLPDVELAKGRGKT